MTEALRKYNGLAPWVLAVATLVVQIAGFSFGYGILTERQNNHEQRLSAIESSDKHQDEKIEAVSKILERILVNVDYIKEAVKERKGQP